MCAAAAAADVAVVRMICKLAGCSGTWPCHKSVAVSRSMAQYGYEQYSPLVQAPVPCAANVHIDGVTVTYKFS